MTFPVVESVTETELTSFSSSHTVNLPATTVSGELLLAFFGLWSNISSASLSGSGWVELAHQGATLRSITILAKVATGSEASSETLTLNTSGRGGAQVWRISGWGGTIADDIDLSSLATGSSGGTHTPNPVTAGWGEADNLYIAAFGRGNDPETVTGWPYPDNQLQTQGDGGANATGALGVCSKFDGTGSSDTPGSFTITGSSATVMYTLVVEPSSGAPSISVPVLYMHRMQPHLVR